MQYRTFFIVILLLLTYPVRGQTLSIEQPLQEIPNSSVLVQYKNLFGKHEMPDRDLTFPFALIVMQLEGSGTEVKAAKEYIQLDLGTQKVVTDQYRGKPNEIWFLVEHTIKNVYISCGEGCEKQLLASSFRFIPNKVYVCKVKYTPEEIIAPNTQPQIHNQYLQFKVEPKDATVEVDGQIWKVENGSARKFMEFGTYKYVVKAADYKSKEGIVTINDPNEKQVVSVKLEPNFAYITFRVENNAEIWIDEEKKGNGQWHGTLGLGQHQITTKKIGFRDNTIIRTITMQDGENTIQLNAPTPIYGSLNIDVLPNDATIWVDGQQKGTTPCVLRQLLIGEHKIRISAVGYNDYTQTVTISENQMTTITATMEKEDKCPTMITEWSLILENESKTSKKEAARLKKEGWEAGQGAPSIGKQVERGYLMVCEYDENLFPKYIMANAQSIGENYDAAKTDATSLAIASLVYQIQTEVTALIENAVANKQLSANDASTITETVMASKNLINQSLGSIVLVVDVYRKINDTTEVFIRLACDWKEIQHCFKNIINQELEKKNLDLHNQLDDIFKS